MKKLKLFDGKIIDGNLGYDHATGWSFPFDVQSVVFEDGSILENPKFKMADVLEKKNAEIESKRKARYQNESDPLFFAYQRGEVTKEIWLDEIEKIKSDLPKSGTILENPSYQKPPEVS